MRIDLHHGDCIAIMRRLIAEGVLVDSIVSDPPYHLQSIVDRFGSERAAPAQVGQTGAFARASAGFMGQEWDGEDDDGRRIAFEVETWELAYQLLKPGGWLLAFGHVRTIHRMTVAIEDAGFDIRDQLDWLYASGFPKSRDVGRDIDKHLGKERPVVGAGRSGPALKMGGDNAREWHDEQAAAGGKFQRTGPGSPEAARYEDFRTALKPAREPICMARKPMRQSVAANVLEHGTGALNVRDCRIAYAGEHDEGVVAEKFRSAKAAPTPRNQQVFSQASERPDDYNPAGRWPANVLHDGSPEVVAMFPTTAPARSGKPRQGKQEAGWQMTHTGSEYDDDGGTAARFFFSAKADASDRVTRCRTCGARAIDSDPTCIPERHVGPTGPLPYAVTRHPTVKPLDLMRWLVRLVTPPGGTVLDLFAGTGSTGIAADREGMRSILIEQSEDYVGDIRYRIAEAQGMNTPLFASAGR